MSPLLTLYDPDHTLGGAEAVQSNSVDSGSYRAGDLLLLPARDGLIRAPHLALIYDPQHGSDRNLSLRVLIGSRWPGDPPPFALFPGPKMRLYRLSRESALSSSESFVLTAIIEEIRERGHGRTITEVIALALIGVGRLKPHDLWWLGPRRLVRKLFQRGVCIEIPAPADPFSFPITRMVH